MHSRISSLVVAAFVVLAAGHALADDPTLKWQTIVGIIQAGNVVAGIGGGGQPWSTLGGNAIVHLDTSRVDFRVDGLVLAGGNAIGTRAAIENVKGTLVCAAGTPDQAIVDTEPVPLDELGDAKFEGEFLTPLPAICSSPTAAVSFLVRIAANAPGDRWLANGAVLVR
jgi:hypothetical protein